MSGSQKKQLVIIGGGFAGLWSAFSAIRFLKMHQLENEVNIHLINKDSYHGIRPRYYENDLHEVRISLHDFLTPLKVEVCVGEVRKIDPVSQQVWLSTGAILPYDRLILATGSQLVVPAIPGLSLHAFNVDTYEAAVALQKQVEALPSKKTAGRFTIVVAGGSFTGIEAATDLADRLKKIAPPRQGKVILIDRSRVASRFSPELQEVIFAALKDLGIEARSGVQIKEVFADHIVLDSGERIDTETCVWTAGMQSSPLTQQFNLPLDPTGRLPVNAFLQLQGLKNVFAAGDVAAASTDGIHTALLSCQHAMPQGRFAGNNAAASLFGKPMLPYEQPIFVTCLDLGSWGAVYTEGWDQKVVSVKAAAKERKLFINHHRIYPPAISEGIEALMNRADPIFKPMKF